MAILVFFGQIVMRTFAVEKTMSLHPNESQPIPIFHTWQIGYNSYTLLQVMQSLLAQSLMPTMRL